jgi:hypothetical protein
MVNQIFRPGKSTAMSTIDELRSRGALRGQNRNDANRNKSHGNFAHHRHERRIMPFRDARINWEGRRRYLAPMLETPHFGEYISHLKLEITKPGTYLEVKLNNIKTLGDIGSKSDIEFLDRLTRQGINDELKYAISNAVENIKRRCQGQ